MSALEEDSRKAKIQTPAIIVVGKVCALSEEFSWYEKRELAGRQIVVTRARNKAGRLTKELRDAGAEVLEIPMIDTTPIRPEQVDLSELLAESEEREVWITFTSPTGVETFFGTTRCV